MTPGEILFGAGRIALNAGRPTEEIDVRNTSDHTIFVSSHYPFFEVNRRLVFDRARAWGRHLDIPAGDSAGWRPGEVRRVRLVAFGGRGVVRGFNRLTEGPATPERLAEGLGRVRSGGYGHVSSARGGRAVASRRAARPARRGRSSREGRRG
jgi:urease subunit gamma/beta